MTSSNFYVAILKGSRFASSWGCGAEGCSVGAACRNSCASCALNHKPPNPDTLTPPCFIHGSRQGVEFGVWGVGFGVLVLGFGFRLMGILKPETKSPEALNSKNMVESHLKTPDPQTLNPSTKLCTRNPRSPKHYSPTHPKTPKHQNRQIKTPKHAETLKPPLTLTRAETLNPKPQKP